MIEIPAMGVLFWPILAYLFWVRSRWLFHLVPISMCLQGGAVILFNAGGILIGFQPAFVAAFAGLLRYAIDRRQLERDRFRAQVVTSGYLPWILLAIWAAVTGLTLPWLFAGDFLVQTGRDGFVGPGNWLRNGFGSTNLSQPFYAGAFTAWSWCYCQLSAQQGFWREFDRALAVGTWMAVGIGYIQWLANTAGLDLTSWFFKSNRANFQVVMVAINGIYRFVGPFSEASWAAYFYSAMMTYYLVRHLQGRGRWSLPLAGALLVAVALTQSSTGVAGVLAGVGLCALIFVRRGPTLAEALGIASVPILACVALYATDAWILMVEFINDVFREMVIEKTESTSWEQRTGADTRGFQLLLESLGLGIGWGSHRPSSYIAMVAANGGILALILVAWGVFNALFRHGLRGIFPAACGDRIVAVRCCLVVLLLLHSISIPEMTSMLWWVMLAAALAPRVAPPEVESLSLEAVR